MIAERVVNKLLETDEDEIDPKEFAYRGDVRFSHPVWEITVDDMRPWLAEKGYRVRYHRRRSRGSLVFLLNRVDTTVPTTWNDVDALEKEAWAYLDQKFKVGGRGSPFEVVAFGWEPGDPKNGQVDFEIRKAPTDGLSNPYA